MREKRKGKRETYYSRVKTRDALRALLFSFPFSLFPLFSSCSRPQFAPRGSAVQSVVLVSIDGFRADYLDSFPAVNLRALAARGVRARWMQPSIPALTFPNHYTIATGLYPAHHGIVANAIIDTTRAPGHQRFSMSDTLAVWDSTWWGGEPIWVTAEKQGTHAASFFWPGSEAAIKGVRLVFWKRYVDSFPNAARVDTVLSWLERRDSLRPRLVLLYFSLVDHEAHESGPWSVETRSAALTADTMVGRLVQGLEDRALFGSVNVLVAADHGMAYTPPDRRMILDDYLPGESLEIAQLSPFFLARPRSGDVRGALAALRRIPHFAVFPRDSVPARWHYSGHPRILAVVGVMDEGWTLVRRPAPNAARSPQLGAHGYDNNLLSMGALFVAAGPAFRSGVVVEPFQNIHVYELICRILGLKPAPNDGSLDSVKQMLR